MDCSRYQGSLKGETENKSEKYSQRNISSFLHMEPPFYGRRIRTNLDSVYKTWEKTEDGEGIFVKMWEKRRRDWMNCLLLFFSWITNYHLLQFFFLSCRLTTKKKEFGLSSTKLTLTLGNQKKLLKMYSGLWIRVIFGKKGLYNEDKWFKIVLLTLLDSN